VPSQFTFSPESKKLEPQIYTDGHGSEFLSAFICVNLWFISGFWFIQVGEGDGKKATMQVLIRGKCLLIDQGSGGGPASLGMGGPSGMLRRSSQATNSTSRQSKPRASKVGMSLIQRFSPFSNK